MADNFLFRGSQLKRGRIIYCSSGEYKVLLASEYKKSETEFLFDGVFVNVDIMSGSIDELNNEMPKSDILRVDSIRSSTSSGAPALLVFKKVDVGKVGLEIVGEIDTAAAEKN